MSFRRVLPILILALLLGSFGRMGAAEARAMPNNAAMQMPSHCTDQPQPAEDQKGMAIDCMIACAAMAPAADPFVIPPMAALDLPRSMPPSLRTGRQPEADPPPPRFA